MQLKTAAQRYREQQNFWVWEIYHELSKAQYANKMEVLRCLGQLVRPRTSKSLVSLLPFSSDRIAKIMKDLADNALATRVRLASKGQYREYSYGLSELGRLVYDCDLVSRNGQAEPKPEPKRQPHGNRKYDWEGLDPEIISLRAAGNNIRAIAAILGIGYSALRYRIHFKSAQHVGPLDEQEW